VQPSKKHNRTSYTPNFQLFHSAFSTNPERLRNLHFSYVVLLRALKRGGDFLRRLPFGDGGDPKDGGVSSLLIGRLLDSTVLSSCSDVFEAFDESLMFKTGEEAMIKTNFKGVFHNISR